MPSPKWRGPKLKDTKKGPDLEPDSAWPFGRLRTFRSGQIPFAADILPLEQRLIAKSSCGNGIVGGRELVPLREHENSDSGEETQVPALFLGRGS